MCPDLLTILSTLRFLIWVLSEICFDLYDHIVILSSCPFVVSLDSEGSLYSFRRILRKSQSDPCHPKCKITRSNTTNLRRYWWVEYIGSLVKVSGLHVQVKDQGQKKNTYIFHHNKTNKQKLPEVGQGKP